MGTNPRGFEIQGHRGARGLFPENTVEGIRATIALGVGVIELDVAVTADGVPVVFHDVELNPDIVRDASGAWGVAGERVIARLALRDLASLDVGRLRPGSAYAAQFPDQVPQDGARIPTLLEVLEITAAAGVRADVELKTLPARPDLTVAPAEMARLVIETAAAAGALGRLDLRSFDWRGLRAARALRPELPLTWLTSIPVAPATVAAEGGGTWAPEHGTLTRDALDQAHELDLRVVPWTVNDPGDMWRLIAWGVDGICTDYPDRVPRP